MYPVVPRAGGKIGMVLTLRLFSARRRQKNPAETSFNSCGGYAKWGILGQLLRAALAPHCEPCGSKKSHLDLAALSPRAALAIVRVQRGGQLRPSAAGLVICSAISASSSAISSSVSAISFSSAVISRSAEAMFTSRCSGGAEGSIRIRLSIEAAGTFTKVNNTAGGADCRRATVLCCVNR